MLYGPIFKTLAEKKVRYLVVGGVAAVYSGHIRTTADLDLVVDLEPENCRRAIEALVGLGFKPRAPVDPFDFADPVKRRDWIENKGLIVFSFGGSPLVMGEVDLFVQEPFDFEELWSKRQLAQEGDTVANVIDRKSLIEMKRKIGRPRDLEDVQALEQLSDE